MTAMANRPIIIKRKKGGGGDGHHGGAWKVAYADFVTAMMAFFMLMWLLNATSEQQRAGLADYFTPTTSIARTSGGGDGMFGGDSIFSDEQLSQTGSGASMKHSGAEINNNTDPSDDSRDGQDIAEVEALENLEEVLLGRGGESVMSELALRHIVTRQTDEGLVIELFDNEDAALFDPQTAEPTALAAEIAQTLSNLLPVVENPIAVQAHVRSQPIVVRDNTVWQLSMDRATQMRRLIEEGGYDPKRVMRVTGKADRETVVADPTAIRNNRIEVIVLRSDL